MTVIYLVLLLLALVCFLVETFGRSTRLNLLALGLAFWVTVPLLQVIRSV